MSILPTVSATNIRFLGHRIHQYLRRRGDFTHADTGRVLDGVKDRRRWAVHGQLPDSLCTARAEGIRLFLQEHSDVRNVSRRRDNIVRYLAVGHAAFAPYDVLVERHANRLRHTALD